MRKRTVFLGLILLFSALFLFLRSEKAPRLDVQYQGDSFIEGLKIVNNKNGAATWVLTAKRADILKDGKEALLSTVEMDMISQGISVSAERAVYNMETKQVAIEGVIKAHNKNYAIITSQANIDNDMGSIETAQDVRIEGRKFNLEGRGMKADNNERTVRILHNVKAVFHR